MDLDAADPGPSALPAIRLSPPLEAVGTVKWGPAPDSVIPGAMVSFFSLDVSGHSLFLGSALTDSKGRYAAILPDVAQPGIGP